MIDYYTNKEAAVVHEFNNNLSHKFDLLNPRLLGLKEMESYVKVAGSCDMLIFMKHKSFVTFGVAMEVCEAFNRGIPVYQVTTEGILGTTKVELHLISQEIFKSMDILSWDGTLNYYKEWERTDLLRAHQESTYGINEASKTK